MIREAFVTRSDGAIIWHAYYQPGAGVSLPYEVQQLVNDGLATLDFRDVNPSLLSRAAAVPVRWLDRLLRKLIRP